MSPGPGFSELCFLYVGSLMRWLPPWVSKMAATALLPHFLGSGLQVQWKILYASYPIVLAKVFIVSHWLSLDHVTILDQPLASRYTVLWLAGSKPHVHSLSSTWNELHWICITRGGKRITAQGKSGFFLQKRQIKSRWPKSKLKIKSVIESNLLSQ